MIMKPERKPQITLSLTPGQFFKIVRKRLGLTQKGMGEALHVSTKAVQSYEQEWRKIPEEAICLLLTLLYLHKGSNARSEPCWVRTKCPPDLLRKCPVHLLTHGQFCWLVGSHMCELKNKPRAGSKPDSDGRPCLRCIVVLDFLVDPKSPLEVGSQGWRLQNPELS